MKFSMYLGVCFSIWGVAKWVLLLVWVRDLSLWGWWSSYLEGARLEHYADSMGRMERPWTKASSECCDLWKSGLRRYQDNYVTISSRIWLKGHYSYVCDFLFSCNSVTFCSSYAKWNYISYLWRWNECKRKCVLGLWKNWAAVFLEWTE